MQTAGSGPHSPSTAIFATLPVTASGHPGNLGLRAKHAAEAQGDFLRHSSRYPLTAIGDINTYAVFAETFLRSIKEAGRAGFIVPTGIATDDSTKKFFSTLTQTNRLVSLFDFENTLKIFPAIATLVRFSLVTLGNSPAARFAFLLNAAEQISDGSRWFALNVDDFQLINPNTLTCPVFRSRADAELTKKIYACVPVLIRKTRDGEPEVNPWGIRFMTMFHMSNDSHLFKVKTELSEEADIQIGPAAVERKENMYLPLYEAKMMTTYDHRFGSYPEGSIDDTRALPRLSLRDYVDIDREVNSRFYVEQHLVEEAVKDWKNSWFVCFRSMSNHSNIRRFISGVIPYCAAGNSLIFVMPTKIHNISKISCLIANFSTLMLDAVARWKVSGTNLNLFLVEQFPVLAPGVYQESDVRFIGPRVLELIYTTNTMRGFAKDFGYGEGPFIFDPSRRANLRAELDAYYAYLYGLTRDELRYILDPADVMGPDYPSETFRVLKNNEIRDFGEYRTRRLVLEAWDRFVADGTFDPARVGTETSIDIPAAGDSDVQRRLAAAEATIAALRSEIGDSRTPTLFVEGGTDVKILEAAWSVFYPDETLPVSIISAGGTTQMGSLAARGKALRELLKDRIVCALADNDGEGRALWNDGNLHKGGVWKEQTNGVNWCLLRPTDEFIEIMQAHQIPTSCWPFTVESCFPTALRAQALADGAYEFAAGAQSDLATNPEVAQHMMQVLPGLADDDPASFYLRPPHHEYKDAFADWICAPERRTRENFAAFEIVLERLKALLEGE